ncbi:hypothetical protein CSUI_005449 [Cystoisospora suis]|uniref:Uncharacterized protein n=1 Tax=Cystoisospora suis TaxID=483139 RepID=A0A2C6KXW8_9APIC|nr:hypothetical protein CSUI_005449 [Cystoisospora suis]
MQHLLGPSKSPGLKHPLQTLLLLSSCILGKLGHARQEDVHRVDLQPAPQSCLPCHEDDLKIDLGDPTDHNFRQKDGASAPELVQKSPLPRHGTLLKY